MPTKWSIAFIVRIFISSLCPAADGAVFLLHEAAQGFHASDRVDTVAYHIGFLWQQHPFEIRNRLAMVTKVVV